ncbi:MAG TPA: hypothetical protein VFK06_01095 [Candidatus Angelobacter sp.]|nr:hypothetical protein [Candidatus Angelobacter sp.]
MSTVLDESVVAEKLSRPFIVAEKVERKTRGKNREQSRPLVLILMAITIALNGTALLIGSILTWLALRHSGVMAP